MSWPRVVLVVGSAWAIAACCKAALEPSEPVDARPTSLPAEVRLAFAPFEDDGDGLGAALRFELAERLVWAAGVSFELPIEALDGDHLGHDRGALPAPADDKVTTLSGRWSGGMLELRALAPDGDTLWRGRVAETGLAAAATELARALGTKLAAPGVALPAPSDRHALARALALLSSTSDVSALAATPTDDAWLLLTAGLAALRTGDAQRASVAIERALALAPDLTSARVTHVWLSFSIEGLRLLTATNPRMPWIVATLQAAIDSSVHAFESDSVRLARVLTGSLAPDDEVSLRTLRELVAMARAAPIERTIHARLNFLTAALELNAGELDQAEQDLAAARDLGIDREHPDWTSRLAAAIRVANGRQPSADPDEEIKAEDEPEQPAQPRAPRDCTGATPLIVAAERGDASQVRTLLASGADALDTNLRGQTALHRAAQLGLGDVVSVLLEARGAGSPDDERQRLDAMDDFGRTPLSLAVERDQFATTRLLLAARAGLERRDQLGDTSLLVAARFARDGLISLLLQAGADRTARNADGYGAMELAISLGHLTTIDTLVAAGFEVDEVLLKFAAKSRDIAVLDHVAQALGPGGKLDLVPALDAAIALDDATMVHYLLARGVHPSGGRSPLEAAIDARSVALVKDLATPEAKRHIGQLGMRPVDYALTRLETSSQIVKLLAEPTDLSAWAWLGDREALARALDKNPRAIDQLGSDGLAAIHHAVRAGQLACVLLLLQRGASPTLHAAPEVRVAPELGGWTPLHFAIAGQQPQIAKLLVAWKADLDARDSRGRSARALAQLDWVDVSKFDVLRIKDTAGVELEIDPADMPTAEALLMTRPRGVILNDAMIDLDHIGVMGSSEQRVETSEGFGFGGRGIQLAVRLTTSTILRRADVDGRSDAGTRDDGLESMLLGCYEDAAWPEAERVAQDLVAARDIAVAPPQVRAVARQNLGVVTLRLGDLEAARSLFQSAREAFKDDDDPYVQALLASILENGSEVAWRSDRWTDAVADLRHAIALREGSDQSPAMVPIPWLILGTVYGEWGHYKDAVEATRKALRYAEASWGNTHALSALARGNLAVLLDALGDRPGAHALIFEQLSLLEALGAEADPVQYAVAEANAAIILGREGNLGDARARAVSARDRLLHADAGHYLVGRVLLVLGDLVVDVDAPEAQRIYTDAIARLRGAYGERSGVVAGAMRRLAQAQLRTDPQAGRATLMDAWILASQSDSLEERWPIETELGRLAEREHHLDVAIFFGKQAVATLEAIRASARGVGGDLEKSLVESRIVVWRELADWLIGAGRLEEATRVLDLLKDDEVLSQLTRGKKKPKTKAVDLPTTATEAKIKDEVAKQVEVLHTTGAALDELTRTAKTRVPTPEADKRVNRARDQVREARRRFEQFLVEIEGELGRMNARRAAEIGAMNLRDVSALQGTLVDLGHGAVLVHYLMVEDKLRIIVTTPSGQVGRTADVTAADLNALVFRFRQALTDPRSDPRPVGAELHHLLVEPIEGDLRQAKAETLMVSLDGALRYLPMAALWDGEHWLVERYRVVSFSRAGLDKLTSKPVVGGQLAGLGCGKKVEGFNQLMEVPRELEGIVRRNATDPDGVVPGTVWMDDAFSREHLEELLASKRFTAVHIASHFVFEPGTEADSYLLLGDGGHLTLEDIRYDLRFDGVDLLSLSACNTAVGDAGAGESHEGREIEGFAMLTQQLGAKAVLASLWPVADKSTGTLMRALYGIREADPTLTKADALRQAQLRLIRGKDVLDAADLVPRGPRPLTAPPEGGDTPVAPPTDWSHPYFWAPFILMGNWL